MITYVNTVLVTNNIEKNLSGEKESPVFAFAPASAVEGKTTKAEATKEAGAIIVYDIDAADYNLAPTTKRFKIGVITSEATQNRKDLTYIPIVKWSNIINVDEIKHFDMIEPKEESEDTIKIDFSGLNESVKNLFAEGGCTITLRITYKDMPTRMRKWTESYSYVTQPGDTVETIINALARNILVTPKRQRVEVTKDATSITLVAMKYDDDEQPVTENVYAKVRFDVNMYYSNSKAPGFASNNKYELAGIKIQKTEGETSACNAKLVRDRERAAFDYSGVLHRCCWFDPQPKMVTDINNEYSGLTLEFENTHRTADDLWRKTKQTVELYVSTNSDKFESAAENAIMAIGQAVTTAISGDDSNPMA